MAHLNTTLHFKIQIIKSFLGCYSQLLKSTAITLQLITNDANANYRSYATHIN